MIPLLDLEESYGMCRDICRLSASSFYRSFALLPPEKRRAMYALYAYNRILDDFVDEGPSSDVDEHPLAIVDAQEAAHVASSYRRNRIRWWRSMTRLALGEQISKKDEADCRRFTPDSILNLSVMSILTALSDAKNRFQIPSRYFFDVIDGVETDFTKDRYENFTELELYCERVASSVGLACIHVWGFDGRGKPEAAALLDLARRVGIAYQLTNILRDIKEDADINRVYLPLDEIAAAGYSVEELKRGVANSAFEKLMRRQIDRAEDYYGAGQELYSRLKPDGKRVFGLMTAMYYAILRRIAADPAAVFFRRVRPTRFERVRLAVRWIFCAPKQLIL
jgi:15-cis-phytoene synthase